MTNIIIMVVALFVLMAVFVGLGLYFHRHPDDGDEYLDSDGDHEYYDRSLIEKKEYMRRHPETRGKLRTFSRLFRERKD